MNTNELDTTFFYSLENVFDKHFKNQKQEPLPPQDLKIISLFYNCNEYYKKKIDSLPNNCKYFDIFKKKILRTYNTNLLLFLSTKTIVENLLNPDLNPLNKINNIKKNICSKITKKELFTVPEIETDCIIVQNNDEVFPLIIKSVGPTKQNNIKITILKTILSTCNYQEAYGCFTTIYPAFFSQIIQDISLNRLAIISEDSNTDFSLLTMLSAIFLEILINEKQMNFVRYIADNLKNDKTGIRSFIVFLKIFAVLIESIKQTPEKEQIINSAIFEHIIDKLNNKSGYIISNEDKYDKEILEFIKKNMEFVQSTHSAIKWKQQSKLYSQFNHLYLHSAPPQFLETPQTQLSPAINENNIINDHITQNNTIIFSQIKLIIEKMRETFLSQFSASLRISLSDYFSNNNLEWTFYNEDEKIKQFFEPFNKQQNSLSSTESAFFFQLFPQKRNTQIQNDVIPLALKKEVSFTLIDFKFLEIINFCNNIFAPKNARKTVIIIAQNNNYARLFVFTGCFINGLLEKVIPYTEMEASKEIFQNRLINSEFSHDFSLKELNEIKNKIITKPELLHSILILERKKPQLLSISPSAVVSQEEDNNSNNNNSTNYLIREKEEKAQEQYTKKRKIPELEHEKENNNKIERKKVRRNNNINHNYGSFAEINWKMINPQNNNSLSIKGQKLFAEREKYLASETIPIPENLDFFSTLSFKFFANMIQKVEKQQGIKNIIENEKPLFIQGPDLSFLDRNEKTPFCYLQGLKKYQESMITYLYQFFQTNHYYPLLSWNMGVGKTFVIFGLILLDIAAGKSLIKLLEPKSSVNEIGEQFRIKLIEIKIAIIKSAKYLANNEIKNEINQFFQEEFHKPQESLNNIFPLISQYYIFCDYPEECFWTLLSKEDLRKSIFSYYIEKINKQIHPLYSTEEGCQAINTCLQSLSNLLNTYSLPFLATTFEYFNLSCHNLANYSPQNQQSKIFHAVLFIFVKFANLQKENSYLDLDWNNPSSRKSHFNILRFPIQNVICIPETNCYKDISIPNDECVIFAGHETENHDKANFKKANVKKANVKYTFTIVDEAHKFRNVETQHYKRIQHTINQSKKSFLVTATPIENRFFDLSELIKLFHPSFLKEKQVEQILQNLLLEVRKSIYSLSQNKNSEEEEQKKENLLKYILNAYFHFLFLTIKANELLCLKNMHDPDVKEAWEGEVPTPFHNKFNGQLTKKAGEIISKIEKEVKSIMTSTNQLQKAFIHHDLTYLKKNLAQTTLSKLTENPETFIQESSLISSLHNNSFLQEEIFIKKKKIAFIADKHLTIKALKKYLKSQNKNIQTWQITGKESAEERRNALKQFKEAKDKNTTPILFLTNAGGTSLNISGVELVIKIAFNFNPSAEGQADCRFVRVNGVLETKVSSVFFYAIDFGTLSEKHRDAIQNNKKLWYEFFFSWKSHGVNLHTKLKQCLETSISSQKIANIKKIIPNLYTHFKDIWAEILKTDMLREALLQGRTNFDAQKQWQDAQDAINILFKENSENFLSEEQLYRFFIHYLEREKSAYQESLKNSTEEELNHPRNNEEQDSLSTAQTPAPNPASSMPLNNFSNLSAKQIPQNSNNPIVFPNFPLSSHVPFINLPPYHQFFSPINNVPPINLNNVLPINLPPPVLQPKKIESKEHFHTVFASNLEEAKLLGVAIRKSRSDHQECIEALIHSQNRESKIKLITYANEYIEKNSDYYFTHFDFIFYNEQENFYIPEKESTKKEKVRILYHQNAYHVMIYKKF